MNEVELGKILSDLLSNAGAFSEVLLKEYRHSCLLLAMVHLITLSVGVSLAMVAVKFGQLFRRDDEEWQIASALLCGLGSIFITSIGIVGTVDYLISYIYPRISLLKELL